MPTETILFIVSIVVFAAIIILLVYSMRRQQAQSEAMQDDLNRALSDLRRELNESVQSSVSHLGRMILEQQHQPISIV